MKSRKLNGSKTVVRERVVDRATGEVMQEKQMTFTQVRADRFILLMLTDGEGWLDVMNKVGGKGLWVFMFMVTQGFVSFGDGIINVSRHYRDQMRELGLGMDDRSLRIHLKALVSSKLLERRDRNTYSISQKFFTYGKATKRIEDEGGGIDGSGGVGEAGVDEEGLGIEEGGDVPVPGLSGSGDRM